MTARTPQRRELMQLLGPVITSQGYDLEDLSVTAAGRRSVIRVVVDGDEGIDLDAVASVARLVSETLDATDGPDEGAAAFAGPYVLEVSSPGVDRPLTEARHWRRAVGRLVATSASGEPVVGRIEAADAEQVAIAGASGTRSYPLAGLSPGHIQVEFARPDQASNLVDPAEIESEGEA